MSVRRIYWAFVWRGLLGFFDLVAVTQGTTQPQVHRRYPIGIGLPSDRAIIRVLHRHRVPSYGSAMAMHTYSDTYIA